MKYIIEQLKKDGYYEYLKENSFLIKDLYRHPENYKKIVEYFKEKYHLKITDKISNAIDSVEMLNTVFNTIK